MTSILLIGLAVAVLAYFILMKSRKNKSTKVKRQEKSEVIRQLLALSEQEDRISGGPQPTNKPHGSRRTFVSSSRKS